MREEVLHEMKGKSSFWNDALLEQVIHSQLLQKVPSQEYSHMAYKEPEDEVILHNALLVVAPAVFPWPINSWNLETWA